MQLDSFMRAQTNARANGQQALRQWLLDAGIGEAGTTAALPSHHRYIAVTSPLHRRYIAVTS